RRLVDADQTRGVEARPGFDPRLSELRDDRVPALGKRQGIELDRARPEDGIHVGGNSLRGDSVSVQEAMSIRRMNALSLADDVLEAFKLGTADGGLQIGHAKVMAGNLVPVAPRPHAV